jgi:hypothetical protein
MIFRDALFEYAKQVKDLGDRLFELLSESLGLKPSYLTDIDCNQGQIILGHYYPPCPQPEVAIGTKPAFRLWLPDYTTAGRSGRLSHPKISNFGLCIENTK